jgi:hypothetical protein
LIVACEAVCGDADAIAGSDGRGHKKGNRKEPLTPLTGHDVFHSVKAWVERADARRTAEFVPAAIIGAYENGG